MNEKINPDIARGWEKDSEEVAPTRCAWFRNGDAVVTVEEERDAPHWRVTLGLRKYDPDVNDVFEHKEAALARAAELMLTHKEYVNPTTYTVDIKLKRDCEADLDHLFDYGAPAVLENTENSVLNVEVVETN
jgi:hypothetical protein